MPTSADRSSSGSPTAPPGHEDTWISVATAYGPQRLRARLYRTPAVAATALVLHFHAGAFTAGTLDSGTAVAMALAAAGAAVVSLDYPLAPAHPFPAAVEAGHGALVWLGQQRKRLTGNLHVPLFVAGEEAGGNLAAAVAMVARDRGGPALAGQLLLSPMLDTCVATASQRDARSGPVGCPCADGWRAYLPEAADATHPYAAPGASMRLQGLPPTWLVTAQDDPLRDETLAYALRLRAAGIGVVTHVLPGPTHWPMSYRNAPASAAPPWAAALCTLFQAALSPAVVAAAPSRPASRLHTI